MCDLSMQTKEPNSPQSQQHTHTSNKRHSKKKQRKKEKKRIYLLLQKPEYIKECLLELESSECNKEWF